MTILAPPERGIPDELLEPGPAPDPAAAVPRAIPSGYSRGDRVFRRGTRSVGVLVLVLTGSIAVFLGAQVFPTVRHYGLRFFTETNWSPGHNVVGIAAVLLGTVEIAVVAMVFAVPLSLGMALYITEYAPARLKPVLVSLVDLMAAVPSIVYGLFVRDWLQKHALYVAHWLSTYLGWIPFFHVDTDPHRAQLEATRYTSSAFIAGMAVAMMTTPMACAVMREVFAQAPLGEREAAFALGGTRWGVIRTVVLPFGRSGIVGGTMLGLGRALGETISVVLIVSPIYDFHLRPLQLGVESISALIAGQFPESSGIQLDALLAAGFVLFVITLIVNTLAAVIVNRGRSGAQTDL